ncbi:MAG TPA: PDZ domain-containing protein [Pseudoxanthomonas sp.]
MPFRFLFTCIALGIGLIAAGDASAAAPPTLASTALQSGSQARYLLGAVVDVRRANVSGVTLLAVTPGGAADRIGLQPGDQLISVNGQRLDNTLTPSSVLENALQHGKGALQVEALRNGKRIALSGRADQETSTPAVKGQAPACGYVSTLGAVPKVSRGIHDAIITSIDGQGTPLEPPNRHRLTAGRHVLVVSESIDDAHLSSKQRQDRYLVLRRLQVRANKALVVDVKPGVRLRIGAQLLRDRLDTQNIRENLYWEPVVWEEVADKCP